MGDYRVLSFIFSDRSYNTVRLTCLSLEDPPFLRLVLSELYPQFIGGRRRRGDLIRTVLGVMISNPFVWELSLFPLSLRPQRLERFLRRSLE